MEDLDPRRTALLRDRLARRLEVEALRGGFTPTERALWIAERLEDYVGRVAGVFELPGCGMHDAVEMGMVRLVKIGSDILERELQGGVRPPEAVAHWLRFQSAWISFGHQGNNRIALELWDAIRQLRTALETGSGDQG
jgi:hypothetical protein